MSKINIYQTFPRLFGNENSNKVKNGSLTENGCGKFRAYTPEILQEIKDLGITHVWYTGVIEHATQSDYSAFGIQRDNPFMVKGKAGSPYAVKDYYDVSPDLAENVNNRMKEFEELVKQTHNADLKVIIDFVPNHVAREYRSDKKPKKVSDLGENDDTTVFFSPENNFYYLNESLQPAFDYGNYTEFPAKATGNNQFSPNPNRNDWYETIKLNYGVDYSDHCRKHFLSVPDTWKKMRDILLFWAKKSVDGFRCDMAEMAPLEFWQWAIPIVKTKYPSVIFLAEVYNQSLYRSFVGAGFDYLYDKEPMYDTLRAIICGHAPARHITHCWQSVDDIQSHMLRFLENHDEQRIASGFFAGNPHKALPAMIVCATLSTSPTMIYFGQELGEQGMDEEGFSGQDGRTTIFDYWQIVSVENWRNGKLSKEQKELRRFYKKLLNISIAEKAIVEGSMYDLMWVNEQNPHFNPDKQFAFLRKKDDELLLIAVNFDDKDVSVEISIPQHAFDYLNLTSNKSVKPEYLLSGKKSSKKIILANNTNIKIELCKFGGEIIKVRV